MQGSAEPRRSGPKVALRSTGLSTLTSHERTGAGIEPYRTDMDFTDTVEELAWREECRSWLAENAPAYEAPGSAMAEIANPTELKIAKEWQALKFDAGFAKVTWEPEFGGRGGTTMQQIIFNQEEGHYAVPSYTFVIGLGMIAPTIRAVGTQEQIDRYLRNLLRGEEIWCQLFS